ncbi:hypothetical protein [Chitinophaga solisilvae]|uniref:Uncharacterized protein n=1 Tax=Chitinophaga solisilvae TaxID=1233460 RepID=A0A9Q5D3I0_9BACT|nr:hypothetical protein [Chitinophaga solisilvae]NSL85555.1 hypothetical protein [Chitinophaga solisilvae]
MKKETRKLKLSKVVVARLNKQVESAKRPTVGDWTCEFTLRTCASVEFSC